MVQKGGGKRSVTCAAMLCIAALVASGSATAAGVGTRAQSDWSLPVHDDTRYGQIMFDRFEYQAGDDEDVFLWDAQAWYGGDTNRLWITTEGEDLQSGDEGGEVESFDVQFSHRFDRFWDVQAGVGYQTTYGPGPDRDRASVIVGVQGLAPYWFEVDAGLRVSEDGDASAEFEAEYDWRFTQRLVLQARGETSYAFDEVEEFGVGEGLTGLTVGLRARYHISREFAPYVGLTWRDRFGDTADLLEAEGEDTESSAVVAGVRWWF
ncbi:copper resistance protein B [Halofilum ochraceum]|uniref:copper resistance protein B n=1 Tax=Halofilum ochraceum TaxID=1611323 RepID=UPI000831F5DB|nr:copper resistance protein B [Halofilum ochraceum]